MLNENAKTAIRLLSTGEGLPLAPENIGVTKAAFPVLMDTIMQVMANAEGTALVAVGLVSGGVCFAWVSDDGPDGWQMAQTCAPTPTRWQVWRERFRRAWAALCGRD